MNGAARIVLRDWSLGKIMRFTTPPVSAVNATVTQSSPAAKLANLGDSISQLYVNDEAIISIVQTRKERRKQGGLVAFTTCGSIDPRKAVMEESWNGSEENSDGEGDDDEVEGMNEADEEGEEEDPESSQEAEDAESADEMQPHPSSTHKRKRGPERSMPLPRAKKVAFAKESMEITQQKQKPVQASKSLTAPTIPKPSKKGKIANVTVKTRPKGHIVALAGESRDKSEPEVYDFGKFF